MGIGSRPYHRSRSHSANGIARFLRCAGTTLGSALRWRVQAVGGSRRKTGVRNREAFSLGGGFAVIPQAASRLHCLAV